MKGRGDVRQQLGGVMVVMWVMLLMRVRFGEFPHDLPTYLIAVVAVAVTGLFFLYPRMQTRAPALVIRNTALVKSVMGIIIVAAALALTKYVVALKGAPLPHVVLLLCVAFLAFLFAVQRLIGRSRLWTGPVFISRHCYVTVASRHSGLFLFQASSASSAGAADATGAARCEVSLR